MPDLTDQIELSTGRFLNLRDPDPADISLKDVAHGLSMTCRFSGQCEWFYSVAEHALGVSQRLRDVGADPLTQLAGLHHDDAEAFVTDVPRPAKSMLPDYAELEERVLRATLKSLHLDVLDVHGPAVKAADDWMLAQEAYELMPSRGEHWTLGAEWDGKLKGYGRHGTPWEIRGLWMYHHHQLMREIRARP